MREQVIQQQQVGQQQQEVTETTTAVVMEVWERWECLNRDGGGDSRKFIFLIDLKSFQRIWQ